LSYRLGPEESLAAGLRRSAREQLDLALAGLADARLDRHAAIHDARFTDEIDRRRIAPRASARRPRARRARQGAGGTLARLPAQPAERGGG
jgi:hypothetical protein